MRARRKGTTQFFEVSYIVLNCPEPNKISPENIEFENYELECK
jgi:hypothetical protein